ncbi:MAG: sigma-54 dependent transcriptional regulator [Betaproteobacteria bacterium]|nr:sigma-54 dependent transcriptional regulator [Betaproteobacteria bacterium]
MTNRILVVDDEDKMRRVLEIALLAMGHEVVHAADGLEALDRFAEAPCDLVLTDLRMPKLDGLGLLRALRERGEGVPVVVLTAHGSVSSAVEAMKLGAIDYIIRPFEMSAVELAVSRALAVAHMHRENRFLREEVGRGFGEFVGQSPAMLALYELIRQVAPTRSGVFVIGETGTGKELVARAIHQESGRSGLFVPINCAAIPADLLESELFGHRKGAFTGADKDRMGRFEASSGGTLFLDEVTEMPMALQAKLLRVLQENSVERLGSHRPVTIDLRVVAATNRDPQEAVAGGALRQDLYFRLNVVRLDVPALRERRDDIPLLARHFLAKHCRELGRRVPELDASALRRLDDYRWPGNIRELENMMERAAVLSRGETISSTLLPEDLFRPFLGAASGEPRAKRPEALALEPQVAELERFLIEEALSRAGDNKSAAARLLEISERSLWYKIKKYGI